MTLICITENAYVDFLVFLVVISNRPVDEALFGRIVYGRILGKDRVLACQRTGDVGIVGKAVSVDPLVVIFRLKTIDDRRGIREENHLVYVVAERRGRHEILWSIVGGAELDLVLTHKEHHFP